MPIHNPKVHPKYIEEIVRKKPAKIYHITQFQEIALYALELPGAGLGRATQRRLPQVISNNATKPNFPFWKPSANLVQGAINAKFMGLV